MEDMKESDYKLEKPGCCCSGCGAGFSTGELYISAIKESSNATFNRKDFCRPCWAKCKDTFFSFWQTRRTADDTDKKLNEDTLLSLFQSLSDNEERRAVELRYVLSLYLARKKVLQLIDIREEGEQSLLVFERPQQSEPFTIKDPGLPEDRVQELTETVKDLLK